jgi:PAT family beta-lactamase induction signal transducer AmpG
VTAPRDLYAPPRDPEPRERRATSIAKLATLASLYFAQGLPFGFFTLVIPDLLRERGHSLVAVGLASGLAVPWALKFLWAPLVDRHGSPTFGRRRSWIVPLQGATACLLVALALFSTSAPVAVFAFCVFLANLLAATQDIATDALAVDILEPHERGFGNGLQVGSYRVGMILGGSAIVIVLTRYGARAAFLSMAVLLLLATAPVLFTKERPAATIRPADPQPERGVHFLRRADAPRVLALIAIYKLGDQLATAMLKPFARDHGFSLEDQAFLVGTYGSLAGMVGALVGGALVGPLGRRRALVVFGGLQILTVGAYACAAAGIGGRSWIYGATTLEHLVSGMATAALFTVMMDLSRPERAATDYTVQASAFVLAGGVAQMTSGFIAEPFGYLTHFTLAAVLAAASVPAALWLYPARSAPTPNAPTPSAPTRSAPAPDAAPPR